MDVLVNQHTVEDQMLMGARTSISPRQSTIVASFSVSYPVIMAGPKASRDYIQDFGDMKTFKEWDKGDS